MELGTETAQAGIELNPKAHASQPVVTGTGVTLKEVEATALSALDTAEAARTLGITEEQVLTALETEVLLDRLRARTM